MSKKKREYWPYAIVLVLLTQMTGIVYAMSVMMSHSVPLVADDYYIQELAFQGQIDKEQRIIADGRTPEVNVLRATSALEVTYPNYDAELNAIKGKITFLRPSDPSMDHVVTVKPEADAKQWLNVKTTQKGLWLLQFDFEIDGNSYYYEEEVVL
jgi:hypothetical protein